MSKATNPPAAGSFRGRAAAMHPTAHLEFGLLSPVLSLVGLWMHRRQVESCVCSLGLMKPGPRSWRGAGPARRIVPRGTRTKPRGVGLQALTRQVFSHEVGRVGRTLDLGKTNLLAHLRLLQPKGDDIQVPDPAHALTLEDTQRCGCIYTQSGVEHKPKVRSKGHATKGFCRSTYHRQQFKLGTAMGKSILGFRPSSNTMSP